jgi:hypothetical protein
MILSGFYKNKIDQSFSKIIFTLKHGNITISIFSVKLIALQMKIISLILLLINQKKTILFQIYFSCQVKLIIQIIIKRR